MIRIASDFFIPVFGSELIKDFETATAEPEIEDIYKFTYAKVSKCNIRTYKRYAPFSKASTDGLMECEYTGKRTFHGIQEVKFRKSSTDWQIKQQFIQAVMYAWMFDTNKAGYNFQVFIMNSENFIVYVFVDQIRPLLDEMYKAFPNVSYSPCNAYKDHTIQQIVRYTDIPYNKYDVEDKTKLHEIWKDIYKHCIE